MDKLKELLGEALFSQVVEKLPKDQKFVFGLQTEFIPKYRFDEVIEQNKEVKKTVELRDGQLAELSKKVTGNDDLVKQLETLRQENERQKVDYENTLTQRQLDYVVNSTLQTSKVKNVKAVRSLLDMSKVKLGEGEKVEGLVEQVQELIKTDPYLFDIQTETKPTIPVKVGVQVPNNTVGKTTKEQNLDLTKL
jgi:hypothetical protein